MSDNTIELRDPIVEPIAAEEHGNTSPVYVITANGQNGLETEVVDVRDTVPDAFPPRTVDARYVTDTASFLAEIKRRPLTPGGSTVWANRKEGEISAVYDELDTAATADYTRRDDQLVLKFVPDPDWATLAQVVDGKFRDQEAFGNLLESAGHLVVSHPLAELMEIVDSIRGSKSGKFESRIQRATSSQSLTFTEEVSARAGSATRPLEVPKEIEFSARPFEDYPAVPVKCWLRLSVQQGELRLALVPQPYDHLIRAAWTSVVDDLAEELGVPVYAANL